MHKDRQRKWKLVLISMVLITLGLALTGLLPAIGSSFGTYVSAIIGLNAVYGGANVASKFASKDDYTKRQTLSGDSPSDEEGTA